MSWRNRNNKEEGERNSDGDRTIGYKDVRSPHSNESGNGQDGGNSGWNTDGWGENGANDNDGWG